MLAPRLLSKKGLPKMINTTIITFALCFFAIFGCTSHNIRESTIGNSELVILEPRPNVKLKMMVMEPSKKPIAVLVLFSGGPGMLKLCANENFST